MAGSYDNPEFISWAADFLNRKFQEQAWWRRKSNTVTAAVGLFVTLGAWAASQWASEPWAPTLTLVVGFVATVFGVSKTPNGITKRDVRSLESAAGRAGSQLSARVTPEAAAESAINAFRNAEQVTKMIADYRSGNHAK